MEVGEGFASRQFVHVASKDSGCFVWLHFGSARKKSDGQTTDGNYVSYTRLTYFIDEGLRARSDCTRRASSAYGVQ